jgi:excisionase family DNA binding protein
MHQTREKPVELRRLLTTAEAARLASCSQVTIRRAAESGRLRALRLGARGDYRIPPDALTEWMHPQQVA